MLALCVRAGGRRRCGRQRPASLQEFRQRTAAQLAPADASADKVEKPPPTLAYAVAVLSAVIVLCIICVPSRKAESSTSR